MAIVYVYQQDGTYQRRNEYDAGDMTVEDAVENIIGNRGDWAHDTEYRVTPGEEAGLCGYGAVSVYIEREDDDGEYEPYMIIGGND